jgi:hypothetical protein
MDYRSLLPAALLYAGLAAAALGLSPPADAETIAVDGGIAVKESAIVTPRRGMTMEEVATRFGAPVTKEAPVGRPPIARWEYPGFVVYFEHQYVIHSVVANS